MTKCAVVPVSATSADILDEQRRTRVGSSGLLCAIDGYPAKGCGDAAEETTAASPSDSASATPEPGSGSGSNTSTYLAIGAGVLIAVLLLAAMAARRRSEHG